MLPIACFASYADSDHIDVAEKKNHFLRNFSKNFRKFLKEFFKKSFHQGPQVYSIFTIYLKLSCIFSKKFLDDFLYMIFFFFFLFLVFLFLPRTPGSFMNNIFDAYAQIRQPTGKFSDSAGSIADSANKPTQATVDRQASVQTSAQNRGVNVSATKRNNNA